MPGSATANILQKSPLELAIRAMLAFGIAIWLSSRFSPLLLQALLHYYETLVHGLDNRYWIDFALGYQTGHDKAGSDLVLLGRAEVKEAFAFAAGHARFVLQPGQQLKCSTAIGVLMQPAVMLLGLLLAWPLRSAKDLLWRGGLGGMMLGVWLGLGLPLSLWLYFQEIPGKAFAPASVSPEMLIGDFLLNGGSLVVGALLAAVVLAAAPRLAHSAQHA